MTILNSILYSPVNVCIINSIKYMNRTSPYKKKQEKA